MRALILSGYGINCEDETLNAFKTAGIYGDIIHVNDLIENPRKLKNFQILALPGGFSYEIILVQEMQWRTKLKIIYLNI